MKQRKSARGVRIFVILVVALWATGALAAMDPEAAPLTDTISANSADANEQDSVDSYASASDLNQGNSPDEEPAENGNLNSSPPEEGGEEDENDVADEVEDDVDPTLAAINPDNIDLTGRNLSAAPCLSVGAASGGRLVNGVQLASAPGMIVRDGHNWGTPETVAALKYAVAKVNQQYPRGTHLLVVGDISAHNGGKLRPHRSHQSGRDVDISFYHKGKGQPRFFESATAENLDVPRTWALLEALMEDNKTEYIFIDSGVQAMLYNYVKYKLKAPDSYLDTVFEVNGHNRRAMIRHARGHRNHIHARFWSPIAVAAARNYFYSDEQLARLAQAGTPRHPGNGYIPLASLDKVDRGPMPKFQTIKDWQTVWTGHTVRKGETPSAIARRYGVKTATLMRWNGLKSSKALKAGRRLKVQTRKQVSIQVPVAGAWEDDSDTPQIASNAEPTKPIAAAEVPMPTQGASPQTDLAANVPEPVAAAAPTFRTVERVERAKVKSGDTLSAIAKRSRTTVDQIARLNGLKKNAKLKPGQSLKVRVKKERIPVEPTVTAAAISPEVTENALKTDSAVTVDEPASDDSASADDIADAAIEMASADAIEPASPHTVDMEYRVMDG
ncbi:MAG: penicillin-insensitive murein endopeptidase, partial [Deltaproteobacteria bacterium]|nr:penicillin-insensitive murein endopeptidase [Deltaproteobacteria bacterium]